MAAVGCLLNNHHLVLHDSCEKLETVRFENCLIWLLSLKVSDISESNMNTLLCTYVMQGGWTPLRWACEYSHCLAIQALVANNCVTNTVDKVRMLTLMRVCSICFRVPQLGDMLSSLCFYEAQSEFGKPLLVFCVDEFECCDPSHLLLSSRLPFWTVLLSYVFVWALVTCAPLQQCDRQHPGMNLSRCVCDCTRVLFVNMQDPTRVVTCAVNG